MSIAAAGRELLQHSLGQYAHGPTKNDLFAIEHEQSNVVKDKFIRLMTQDERIQRYKMLSGVGMQQSLSHRGYQASPSDSLTSEMARQRDLQTGIQSGTSRSRLPAGLLSGIHFEALDDAPKPKHGIRIVRKDRRDPILAKGKLEISYGYDVGHRALRQHKSQVKRNPITGEGSMKTHGFDSFRRPMVGGRGLQPRSQLNVFHYRSNTKNRT